MHVTQRRRQQSGRHAAARKLHRVRVGAGAARGARDLIRNFFFLRGRDEQFEYARINIRAAINHRAGIDVEIEGDDLIVHGKGRAPGGGVVATHMDHRIAMSALAMGLASEQPVTVDDAAFIATSFPGFADLMRSAGADLS